MQREICSIFEETWICIKQTLKSMIICVVAIFLLPIRILDNVGMNFVNLLMRSDVK